MPMSHNPIESLPLLMKIQETFFFNHMGCVSQSSVDVGPKEVKKQRVSLSDLVDQDNKLRREGEEKADRTKRRSLWAAFEFPKLRFSERVHFLMMRFKSLSHLFVHKEENEEVEMEMEIGHPTDVTHVTHIGWDGSTTVNPVMGWENLKAPELLSLPSISLKQFDLAMSTQARGPQTVNAPI